MNQYKDYIASTYNRIKEQGVITPDVSQWSNIEECDDLFYKINISCLNMYSTGVKEISTTPKCVKLVLNNDKIKYIKGA